MNKSIVASPIILFHRSNRSDGSRPPVTHGGSGGLPPPVPRVGWSHHLDTERKPQTNVLSPPEQTHTHSHTSSLHLISPCDSHTFSYEPSTRWRPCVCIRVFRDFPSSRRRNSPPLRDCRLRSQTAEPLALIPFKPPSYPNL